MEQLLNKLNSPDEAERIYAVQDIAEIQDPNMAIFLLNRLTAEKSQTVKDAIVFSLKNLPCSGIYTMLFELCRSSNAYLRNAAVSIFGAQGNESIPFLSSYREEADREVRKLILDALFAIASPDAVQAIRSSLDDPSMNVKITAVEYLGQLEDRRSADKMMNLLQKEDEPMLKIAILESFCLMGEQREVSKILSILIPDSDIAHIDLLYLPHVLRLWIKIGDPDMICSIIDAVPDIKIYAEDIIYAIEQANQEFKNICQSDRIIERIQGIMNEIEDENLYTLCEELLGQKK